jgi:GT2 family glycosyltransferase
VSENQPANPNDNLPALAVVVVNWNGLDELQDCFSSLQDARYPDLRLIMVDNGSVDNSIAWTKKHFPTVEIIASDENLRWAGGNNLALIQLQEENFPGYILLLNNDTIVPEGSLRRLVAAMEKEPKYWASTPRICYAADPSIVWYDGGIVGGWTGWVRHAGIRRRAGAMKPDPRTIDYATGCAMMLGPTVLQKVGLLDEGFFFYGEDTDYSLRIRALGGEILHLPAALVLHKVSATVGAHSPRKAWLRSRSHMRLLAKHWPLKSYAVLIPAQLAYLAGHGAWHLWHGRPDTAMAVFTGAIDELRGKGY